MTDLVDAVQKHDIGSELISLFELALDSETLYFHPGLDENLDKLYFEEVAPQSGGGHVIREYEPFPISMTGVEFNADGATNRPTLTVANVSTLFSSSIDTSNEDLIGKTVTVRQTLKSKLSNETTFNTEDGTGKGSLPIEFPKKKFIIDRIAGETPLAITFELSSPYDLQGIKLPNRQVIGKYCSWIYQAGDDLIQPPEDRQGGCYWRRNGTVDYYYTDGNDDEQMNTHKAYFDVDDNPLVLSTQLTATVAEGHTGAKGYIAYSNASGITKDTYHEHPINGQNTVWLALKAQTTTGASQIAPQINSKYWLRAEVCGKKLTSCKCRFQFTPDDEEAENSFPTTDKNTKASLPFGAFPGTKKFR